MAHAGVSKQSTSPLARRFARCGAAFVMAARRRERLAHLEQEIRDRGGAALAVEVDGADEASIVAGYDAAEREVGVVGTVVLRMLA